MYLNVHIFFTKRNQRIEVNIHLGQILNLKLKGIIGKTFLGYLIEVLLWLWLQIYFLKRNFTLSFYDPCCHFQNIKGKFIFMPKK